MSGMNHLSPECPGISLDHFLTWLGINVVDIRAAVLLNDPSRRAIVVNGQRGFVRSTPDEAFGSIASTLTTAVVPPSSAK